MIQSQINRNIRLDLADAILLSKAKKDLSFAEIADGTGLAEAFVTAALLGQQARRLHSTVADDSTAWLH